MIKFDDSYASDTDLDSEYSSVPHPSEQRRENRQPMNLDGVCEIMDPVRHIPCTVVDMSGSGAQLAFESTDPIPATFKVHIAALNVFLECRVVWRKQTLLGVEQSTRSAGHY